MKPNINPSPFAKLVLRAMYKSRRHRLADIVKRWIKSGMFPDANFTSLYSQVHGCIHHNSPSKPRSDSRVVIGFCHEFGWTVDDLKNLITIKGAK